MCALEGIKEEAKTPDYYFQHLFIKYVSLLFSTANKAADFIFKNCLITTPKGF